MFAKLFILSLAFYFTVTFASSKRRAKKAKLNRNIDSLENYIGLASMDNSFLMEHSPASTSSLTGTLSPPTSLSGFELSADLSGYNPDFIIAYLEANFDNWLASTSPDQCALVMMKARVVERFGLHLIHAALSQKRFDLVKKVLDHVVMPLTSDSLHVLVEMFKQVLYFTKTDPSQKLISAESPKFIKSAIEILKTEEGTKCYANLFRVMLPEGNNAIYRLWSDAAIRSQSFSACSAVMQIVGVSFAGHIALFIFSHFHIPVANGPKAKPSQPQLSASDQERFLNYVMRSLGFARVLVAAFEKSDSEFLKLAAANLFWNCMCLQDFRRLLSLLKYDSIDNRLLVEGLLFLYKMRVPSMHGELLSTTATEIPPLLQEAIKRDDMNLLRAIVSRRYQCESCCMEKKCQRIDHFVREAELIEAYRMAIQTRASNCMRVFFSGIFEWTMKVDGHRFLPFAFRMGCFDFALKMMQEHRIEINLTDTPTLNPSGDLLSYAVENPRVFAHLVEKGAYVNVRVLVDGAGEEPIYLVYFLLRSGKHELAELLIKKGARYEPAELVRNANMSGNAETIRFVEQFAPPQQLDSINTA